MIFFDLDDTLLDHKTSEYLGVKAFYNKYKDLIKIEESNFYKLWCEASEKYFNEYLKGKITFRQQQIERIRELFLYFNINLSDEEARIKFDIYLEKYEENWRLFDDVISCLGELRSCYRLGIISNGDINQQTLKLEKLKIKDYFDIIITAGEFGIAKPDPRLFQIACDKANLNPHKCYYVGDDFKIDILSCRKIGMKGILVNRKDEIIDSKDINVINSLMELKYALI